MPFNPVTLSLIHILLDSIYVAVSTALIDEEAYSSFVNIDNSEKEAYSLGKNILEVCEDGDFGAEIESVLGCKGEERCV